MTRWVAAVAVVCAWLPAVPAAGQDDLAKVSRITLAEAKKAIDARTVVVVDIRDPYSYAAGHIPGAILIPLQDVVRRAGELRAAKKPVITYCA
jgi:rhodanese-related sulfurtransferase